MSGYTPPRTTSWKYAWNNDSSTQRPTRPGTGKAASERLYNDRGTNRQHREELQRSLASNGPPTDTTKPFVNERSRQLAVGEAIAVRDAKEVEVVGFAQQEREDRVEERLNPAQLACDVEQYLR